jgi:capsular exopolysaccharide synthesis family protein
MTEPSTSLTRRSQNTQVAEQVSANTPVLTSVYPVNDKPADTSERLVAALFRRGYLIAGVAALVAAAGIGLTMMQVPKYSATALLTIDPTPDQIMPERQIGGRVDAAVVDSEIEAIKSSVLVNRLANELQLDQDPEWNPRAAKPAAPQTIPARYATAPQGDPSVTAAVASAIDVRRRGLSYVVEVSGTSASPTRAAQLANSLSSIYLASLGEARQEASSEANGWLDARLEELKAEVQAKEAAAMQYRAQRNLLTAQGESLAEQQAVILQSALQATSAEYAQQRAQYELVSAMAQNGGSLNSLDVQDDAMRDLRSKEATISQKIADMSTRYGAAHPALQQAMQEKVVLDERIASEMQRLAATAKLRSDSIGAKMNTQRAQLNTLRGKLVSDNFDEVQLNALESDAAAARTVYENFLQRSHEIASQGGPTTISARLLSPAQEPTSPISPHLLLNAVLSLVVGIALGLLAGLLAERMRGTIETSEEAEEKLGVRALAAVPDLRRRDLKHIPEGNRTPTGYLLAKRLSHFTEAFRVLQISLMLSSTPHKNVVAVSSAMPGDGKTTLALGLARVAGIGGLKVIIVDCDVRMRTINKVLDIEPEAGLQHVLLGEREWRDVVGCDQASNIHVLPASALTSKDIFSTGAMERLVQELSHHYDLVVLDCAPVFAVADTRVVAALADSVVVATRAGKTPARATRAAITQLELAGANVLGVVLNRIDVRKTRRRSFYDGLYYSKAFAGYYTREA